MSGGKASGKQPKDIDANSLQDEMSTGSKQPGGGSQKARQAAEQRTKARTTARTASESTPKIAADPFTAALAAVQGEDWGRTWAADNTIMLRMTSKRVKELVDKIRPPAVVRWRRCFLAAKLNGTAAEKLQLVFRQLAALTAGCRVPDHNTRFFLRSFSHLGR
jgi:hypothetical protein